MSPTSTPAPETRWAPCLTPDRRAVRAVPVTRRGRSWVTRDGLVATAATVRPTEAEALALGRRRYPNTEVSQ